MLENKLKGPVEDIIQWVDGLLNSVFGSVAVAHIRDELIELRDHVAQLKPIVPELVQAAEIPRSWPGINLAHQYEGVMRDTINSYTIRFEQAYADRLSRLQMRVVGRVTEAAELGCVRAHRLKTYLRYAPLRRAPDQTQVDLQQVINGLNDVRIDESATIPAMTANIEHINWVLTELITNANRFTPGITSLNVSHADDTITVQVIDTGPGIVGGVQAHIFEPFYQQDPNGAGIGVGLPLARHLIQLNGGTFDLQSNPDDGTTITLHFPAR